MRHVTLLSMKNKSVQNCRFVHHAKFHCIMTTLNKLFKIEFERWGKTGIEPRNLSFCTLYGVWGDDFHEKLQTSKKNSFYFYYI